MRSWAVTNEPAEATSERRLDVEVEEHQLEYNDFEGTIPAGEYGGGTVMIWDRGTFTPDELPAGADPDRFVDQALSAGKLSFTFHGERLKGSYTLIRTRS